MLAARPECHVLIMASERQGSDETVSLERLREEVPVDSRRVHFVGFRPYEEYRLLLRASTVHVYFTAPFALSASGNTRLHRMLMRLSLFLFSALLCF